MVQNPRNPYDVRFGPQSNSRLIPDHLFSREEYLELSRFLDNSSCSALCSVLQEGHYSPDSIRSIVLRDLGYFKNRYEEYMPSEPDYDIIERELSELVNNANHALHRAIVLYEPIDEVLTLIGTEVEPAIFWRIKKGK